MKILHGGYKMANDTFITSVGSETETVPRAFTFPLGLVGRLVHWHVG